MSTNTKLAEAIELAEDAMAYVPEYFANKHGMNRRMAALKEAAAHDAQQTLDRDPISDAFKAGMAAMGYAIWEGKEPCPCRKQAAMLAAAPTPPAPEAQQAAAHEQAQADDWQHLKPYGYAPGNYMSRCRTCGDTPVMDKWAITCRPCAEAKFAASQAQAEREPLTDAEIEEILHGEIALNPGEGCAGRFARAIERAHGIGATTGEQR